MQLVSKRSWLPLFAALSAAGLTSACSDGDDGDSTVIVDDETEGTLVVATSPADAEVTVEGPDDFEETFTGSEVLTELEPGTYTVTASHEGYPEQTDDVSVAAGTASTVTMNLTRENGGNGDATMGSLIVATSPSSAQVTVTGPDDFEQTFDGAELLADLAPGTYQVSAEADGYGTMSDEVEVIAGLSSAVTLNLTPEGDDATLGNLIISASPAGASIEIEGPDGYEETVRGSETLIGLEPGEYTASASADGFKSASDTVSVIAGVTSNIGLHLQQGTEGVGPRVVYRDGNGNLVGIDREDVSAERFVFRAWLENLEEGIEPSADVPGMPTSDERDEIAPSFTQNVAGAWVGYRAGDDVVYPVVGADIRWRIDRDFNEALNSVQFGASDDGGAALGFPMSGIDNDQAMTRTNNRRLDNALFPVADDYRLYNQTGVSSPDQDGFSWVTLFSPDARARARLLAVAMVDGVEVGKEVMIKQFAPLADLEITKTVSTDELNLETDGVGSVSFTVTVTNTGEGDATNVVLEDRRSSGAEGDYTLDASSLPGGATAVDDGFDMSFSLAAGESREIVFDADLSGTDTFCNLATVVEFSDEFRTETPDLSADACVTTIEPDLNVIKDFVDGDGNSMGDRVTVAQNEEATLRIRVPNRGGAEATTVSLDDALTTVDGSASSGDDAAYAIASLPSGASDNGEDGFTIDIGTVGADEVLTYTFPVSASADGEYCDTAAVLVDGSEVGNDEACLVVATPELEITKANNADVVLPGDSYTSTISVTNVGNAPARDVSITDQLGTLDSGSSRVVLVSSSFNGGVSGDVSGGTVSAPEMVDIAPDETMVFTVTSKVPNQAPFGDYCDVGAYESENAGSGEVEACVQVPAFAALQTQLVEGRDSLFVGESTTFASTLYNEVGSNEAVNENGLVYSFGTEAAADNGSPGVFEQQTPTIYFDSDPVRDDGTGLITSTPSNDTAMELVEGEDYTIDTDEAGLQEISFADGFELAADEAIYIVHPTDVPTDVSEDDYSTTFRWESTGTESGMLYDSFAAEITSVVTE